ncbi:MAG: ABC transporter permease [Gemmatimonadota bacterium]
MTLARRSWWHFVYRVTLHAFPKEFRERWRVEMTATFSERIAVAASQRGAVPLGLLLRELTAAIRAGMQERAHTSTVRLQMMYAQDIRYALRLLLRSPGFSLLTVLVLAGGLGLSTFTFSFLYTAMIRALPLGEGDRIVRIDALVNGRRQPIDAADVPALRASLTTLHDVGGYTSRDLIVGREGTRRVVGATVADPVLFAVARTPAFLGRFLLPSDAAFGAEPVIVLSSRTWEAVFAADVRVINSLVPINGVETRVVGVMPRGFGFPVASEAWLPLPAHTMTAAQAGRESLRLVGRLGDDISHRRAAAEASRMLQRLVAARDTSRQRIAVAVESFPSVQFGEERALVFGSLNLIAFLILLLALVNVTNLLLARANERVKETAVRVALGASTGRLVMQGMWETIILCLAGGFFGTAAAAWGLNAITQWTQANMPDNLAFWWVWQMDSMTLLAAGGFVTIAITLLGGVASLRAMRTNVRAVMQDGTARAGSRHEGRLSRALVITQVTTVTVLMFFGVMSGLIAQRVVDVDVGYDPARILQAGVEAPNGDDTGAGSSAIFRAVHDRLAEQEPLDGVLLRRTLADIASRAGAFATRDDRRGGERPTSHVLAELGDLGIMGVQLVEGRSLRVEDDGSTMPVAVISQSLARRYWPQRSPVGEEIRLTAVGDTSTWRTIVGVVSDVPLGHPLARTRSADAIHIPLLQTGEPFASVLVRYRSSELAAREALLQAFTAVDPRMLPDGVQLMTAVIKQAGFLAASVTRLFSACFAFALLLAVAGAYGLMSRNIGLRTREVGVRRALGASDANLTRLLVGQGGRQLGIGALIAAPLLLFVGLVFRYYFPVELWVTVVIGVMVSVAIVSVVLLATWFPTVRVLRTSPREALWSD